MADDGGTKASDPLVDRALGTLREHREDQRTNPAWEARLWDRAMGRVVDFLIVTGAGWLLVFPISHMRRGAEDADSIAGPVIDTEEPLIALGPTIPSLEWVAVFAVALVLYLAYESVSTAVFGATPGKFLFRLRIVNRDDRRPVTQGRLLLRSITWAIPLTAMVVTWFLSVLYAWAALMLLAVIFGRAFRIDTLRETLCDRVAGTAVMDRRLAAEAADTAGTMPAPRT